MNPKQILEDVGSSRKQEYRLFSETEGSEYLPTAHTFRWPVDGLDYENGFAQVTVADYTEPEDLAERNLDDPSRPYLLQTIELDEDSCNVERSISRNFVEEENLRTGLEDAFEYLENYDRENMP